MDESGAEGFPAAVAMEPDAGRPLERPDSRDLEAVPLA
jgi:hypothetical protein